MFQISSSRASQNSQASTTRVALFRQIAPAQRIFVLRGSPTALIFQLNISSNKCHRQSHLGLLPYRLLTFVAMQSAFFPSLRLASARSFRPSAQRFGSLRAYSAEAPATEPSSSLNNDSVSPATEPSSSLNNDSASPPPLPEASNEIPTTSTTAENIRANGIDGFLSKKSFKYIDDFVEGLWTRLDGEMTCTSRVLPVKLCHPAMDVYDLETFADIRSYLYISP